MPSRRPQEKSVRPPTPQGDGDPGTRSGQPNPEAPSHPTGHNSGYGGERGGPKTTTDQRETHKRS
jgi:hypothetical protein